MRIINHYNKLPVRGGKRSYCTRVTVEYRDSDGIVRSVNGNCCRENNRVWFGHTVPTGETLGGVFRVVTTEWRELCHRKDVISIDSRKPTTN